MSRRVIAGAILGGAAWCAALLVPTPAYSHKPITTSVQFRNEIAQIFQRKCFQCHTENNLGVSLLTYTEARPWARAIREEILERRMPPWTAVPGYGHFSNDISLTAREMEIILSWADGGAPSGVLKAEEGIPPVFVPPAPSWDHGVPDQVIAVSKGQVIEASSPFAVKRFVVSTGLTAPRRVQAIGLKQGDRRVVRHAAFYEAGTGRWLGSWTPWQTVTQLPDDVAYRLPAKAQIIVEIGYSGAEATVTDVSELGLYFAPNESQAADSLVITAAAESIAAGTTGQRVRTEMKLATAASALALWPTPSDGARSIEIVATTPDGVITPLLWVKEFRPDWRSPYYLSSPVPLPAGTRLVMNTYFDNPTDQTATAKAQAWITVARASSAPRPSSN